MGINCKMGGKKLNSSVNIPIIPGRLFYFTCWFLFYLLLPLTECYFLLQKTFFSTSVPFVTINAVLLKMEKSEGRSLGSKYL